MSKNGTQDGNGTKKPTGKGRGGRKPPAKELKSVRKPTLKEQKLLEGVLQGKSGARAARDAGYSVRSAKQIASMALTKVDLRAYVDERIKESKVTSDEVIGTLVGQMRANVLTFLREDGSFDMEAARQNNLGHLIKRIVITRRRIPRADGEAEETETTSLELHSAQAAAVQLCKVLGIDQKPRENQADAKEMFERLISDQMEKYGHGRAEVVERILTISPECSRYLM